jgi:hypothetical protein
MPEEHMVISFLTRKTRITDRAAWDAALSGVRPRIEEVLKAQDGYLGVTYYWGLSGGGAFAQVTEWESEEACQNYVRNGAAADVATIEEAAVPTAAYPDGAWVRQNFSAADSG